MLDVGQRTVLLPQAVWALRGALVAVPTVPLALEVICYVELAVRAADKEYDRTPLNQFSCSIGKKGNI